MKLTCRDKSDIIATFRAACESMREIDLPTKAAAILTSETYGVVTPEEVLALAFFGEDGPRKPPAKAAAMRGGLVIEFPIRRTA